MLFTSFLVVELSRSMLRPTVYSLDMFAFTCKLMLKVTLIYCKIAVLTENKQVKDIEMHYNNNRIHCNNKCFITLTPPGIN